MKPHNTTVGTDNIIPTFETKKWRHETSSPMLKSRGQQGQGPLDGQPDSRIYAVSRSARFHRTFKPNLLNLTEPKR